jgi:acetyl-CoA carboxylase carboxyl transferase subunit alpha
VISPEGCAAILWKDGAKRDLAAERLGLTGDVLMKHGVVDEVVAEPPGGAHRRPKEMAAALAAAIERNLRELMALSEADLLDRRYAKLRRIGEFVESKAS